MALVQDIATISGITLMSRVTGLLRDILIAHTLGAGLAADVFLTAFRLPNLFRRLFAEGAFNAAFVPLYAATLETDGRPEADDFASRTLSTILLLLLIVVCLAEIIMPYLLLLFAPGFRHTPGKMAMATELARITFPYLLFISVLSLQAGVLNALHRFAAAAATPVLLNLSMIGFLLGAAPFMAGPAYALVWGVSVAGVLQLLWLSSICTRAGVHFSLHWPRWDARVCTFARRILPVTFGAGLYQVNLMIDTALASLVSDGAVSFLYYADRISQLPLGVVGVAVGTALLPLLARQIGAGHAEEAIDSQNRAIEFALLLTVPATVALIVLAEPIVSTLFERGAFGATERTATATTLVAFSVGLPAYVLNKVLTPGFFARHDTATSVKIAILALIVNVLLSLILMGPFAHVGIALSSALSAWLNVVVLGAVLYRRGQLRFDRRLKVRLPRLVVISLVMGLFLIAGESALAPWQLSSPVEWEHIRNISVLIIGGFIVFASLAHISGTARPSDLKGLRRLGINSRR
ncbi:Proposed peptidoglycan lipid II flippase MurJ [invertebrate metagenome]|uniref:Proposed peptidoglycan lipid II flippase MurJ n=1 Tax=invertebrate metagenome TaxID=1711999 RepID=A0A484H6G9_9ZZZZ